MSHGSQPGRLCVYTVLIGGYEELVDQPVANSSDIPFICFTDDRDLESDSWQFRTFERALSQDAARSSRAPKILPHDFLTDFDTSLYIDNAVLLTADPRVVVETLLADSVMGLIAHSDRSRLDDEFDAVIEARFDSRDRVEEQRAHYRASDPALLELPVLWGAILARQHHDSRVVDAMERWWMHVLRYSRRDQLSLPVALKLGDLYPSVHTVDNREGPFHRWPIDTHRVRDRSGLPWTASEDGLVQAEANLLAAADEAEQLRAELAAAEVDHQRLQGERDLALLGRQAAERRADVADFRNRQLIASRSWRLTEPVRRVSRRLRPRRD